MFPHIPWHDVCWKKKRKKETNERDKRKKSRKMNKNVERSMSFRLSLARSYIDGSRVVGNDWITSDLIKNSYQISIAIRLRLKAEHSVNIWQSCKQIKLFWKSDDMSRKEAEALNIIFCVVESPWHHLKWFLTGMEWESWEFFDMFLISWV